LIGGKESRCRKFGTDILVFPNKSDYQNDVTELGNCSIA
jgi:hypothetical protein